MLSDILPTGFEIGVRYGRVKPGDVVAVVGAGPVGLAAMMTSGLYGAARVIALDIDANRREQARSFGATDTVDPHSSDWIAQVKAMTDGFGVDVAVEAVGIPTPSMHAPRSFAQADPWLTQACTAAPWNWHFRTCGLWMSQSPPAWSAPTPLRCCSSWWPRTGCPRAVRHAHLRAQRHPGGLRHIQPRRRNQGAQGRHEGRKHAIACAGHRDMFRSQ